MIQVIDNIIPKNLQDEIEAAVLGRFPWIFLESTVDHNSPYAMDSCVVDSNTKEVPQFVHMLADSNSISFVRETRVISDYFFPLVQPILYFMTEKTDFTYKGVNSIRRAKMNLLFNDPTYDPSNYHVPHCDCHEMNEFGQPYKTLLYYINDSDGDTVFFNERLVNSPDAIKPEKLTINRRISPKKGSAVLFDSNILHASTSPVTSNRRSVINIVLYG